MLKTVEDAWLNCEKRREFRSRLMSLLADNQACDDCTIDQLMMGLVTMARVAKTGRKAIHARLEFVWDALELGGPAETRQ